MNKINIFLEHLYDACLQDNITLEQALIFAHDMGYSGLECDLWRLSDRERTKALFSRCGLNVASIYAWYDFCGDSSEQSLSKMREHIAAAEFFGAGKIMAIPGFFGENGGSDEDYQSFSERLSVLCSLAGERGITVTIEDFDDKKSPCFDTEGLLRLLRGANGLRLTFDTGNFAYAGEDSGCAYGKLKSYISHVHLKDRSLDVSRANADNSNAKTAVSGETMYPCEAGGGYIGLEALVKQMIRDGYKGDFSVEHFGAPNQLEYMKRSIGNILSWI